ncbi:aminopeptidase M1 [Tanacetum coccineum]
MLVAIWPYIKHQKDINNGLHSLVFSSYEKGKEVEEFFASRAKPSIARTLKQNIELVKINAKWVETCRNEKKWSDGRKTSILIGCIA